MKTIDAKQLAADLRAFSGSENFYRYNLGNTITEGARFLAESAGAFWLLDEISTAQLAKMVRAESFQVWRLVLTPDREHSARLTCDDGNGVLIVVKPIPYTDFPLPEVKLYACDNGEGKTIMLPGEY